MFKETVKSLRLKKRLTLRDFCQQVGVDPSNWNIHLWNGRLSHPHALVRVCTTGPNGCHPH